MSDHEKRHAMPRRQMKKIKCISPDETFFVYASKDDGYSCPVCGAPGLKHPPYYEDGTPSFEMCSCGFEFGFDDSSLASNEAVDGIAENWKRWRKKVIEECSTDREKLFRLEENLKNINIRLAFDLIPVEIMEDDQDGGNNSGSLRSTT